MPDSRPKAVEHGAALGVDVEIVTKDPQVKGFSKRITAGTTPIWRCDLNRITRKLREPPSS